MADDFHKAVRCDRVPAIGSTPDSWTARWPAPRLLGLRDWIRAIERLADLAIARATIGGGRAWPSRPVACPVRSAGAPTRARRLFTRI